MQYIRYFDRQLYVDELPPTLPFAWPNQDMGGDPRASHRAPEQIRAELQSFLADMRMMVRHELLPATIDEGIFRDVGLELAHGTEEWIVRGARWRFAFVRKEPVDLGADPTEGLFQLLERVFAFPLTQAGQRLEVKEQRTFPKEGTVYAVILPEVGGGFGGGRFENLEVLSDGKVTLVSCTEYEWKVSPPEDLPPGPLPEGFTEMHRF